MLGFWLHKDYFRFDLKFLLGIGADNRGSLLALQFDYDGLRTGIAKELGGPGHVKKCTTTTNAWDAKSRERIGDDELQSI